MGSARRWKPERLSEKLLAIREGLGLSQGGLVKAMALGERVKPKDVSRFETGDREPSLPVLLRYARLAGTSTDVLIDDELDLPKKLTRGKTGST